MTNKTAKKNSKKINFVQHKFMTTTEYNQENIIFKLKVLYLNTRSIKNKFEDIEDLISNFDEEIHVIILTETWLKPGDEKYYNLPGYQSYFSSREGKIGGGIGIFIKNHISHNIDKQSTENDLSYTQFTIQLPKCTEKINFIGIYRTKTTSITELTELINRNTNPTKNTIVVADNNINILKTTEEIISFKEKIKNIGLQIVNTKYTTRQGNKNNNEEDSLIDHCLTNMETMSITTSTILNNLSDHNMIILDIDYKYNKEDRKDRNITYIKTDIEKVKQKLDIEIMTTQNTDINKKFDFFLGKVTNIINAETKIIEKIFNRQMPNREWMNDDLRKKIKQREVLHKKVKANNDNEGIIAEFKQKRNEITSIRRQLKKEYFRNKIEEAIDNPKKVWNILNKVLTNGNSNISEITEIQYQNDRYTGTEVPVIFNKYFTEIAHTLKPNHNQQHQSRAVIPNKITEQSFFLAPTTTLEVKKIISNLSNKNSHNGDAISPKIMKQIYPTIITTLTELYNQSIEEAIFPEILKIGQIIPLHKGGNKHNIENYRPIANTSTIAKIFEKIVQNRLMGFLENTKYLYPQQHGFRKKRNTKTAVMDTTHDIKKNLDKGKKVGALFIDLCKAFDTVSHKLLLKTLEDAGIRGHAKRWFSSFLINRSQYTNIKNNKSNLQTITIGVPQGAILSPSFFIMFINDISRIELKGKLTLFADDATLIYAVDNYEELERNMQHDLELLHKYFNEKELTLNTKKTCYMIFNMSQDIDITLTYNNTLLEQVTTTKYLGIHINDTLDWTQHICKIKGKIIPLISVLRRRGIYLPDHQKRKFYYGIVNSHLNYLASVWGHTSKKNVDGLQRVQNKVIKAIFNFPYRYSTFKLYNKLQIIKIENIVKLQTLLYIHEITTKHSTSNINLTSNNEIHKHNTRINSNIHKLYNRTTKHGLQDPITAGIEQYNKLPKNMKDLNVKQFKIKIKETMLSLNTEVPS